MTSAPTNLRFTRSFRSGVRFDAVSPDSAESLKKTAEIA
jgi:hypothetical protein